MRNLLFVLGLILGLEAFAQISVVRIPRDSGNVPLYGGLGLPYLIEPTVNNTTYDSSHRTALSTTGADQGRQYRHMSIYNPSASVSVYICVGNSNGCTTDMWKAPPTIGMVDDSAYFGPANGITYVYYRVTSGSVVPLVRWW